MLFRRTGILLVVITVCAVVGHHAGWALPTLDWFFSFEAREEGLESASWGKKYQANIIGYILCALLMSVGVLCLRTKSRKVNWNPQTLRKLKRFRSITRGYVSLWILVGLLFLTLLDHALVGKRALLVKYDGEIYSPAFVQRSYTAEDFGQEGKSEVDYRKLKEVFAQEGGANWVLLPLVPFDATFDSAEPVRENLIASEGVFYRGGRDPPTPVLPIVIILMRRTSGTQWCVFGKGSGRGVKNSIVGLRAMSSVTTNGRMGYAVRTR